MRMGLLPSSDAGLYHEYRQDLRVHRMPEAVRTAAVVVFTLNMAFVALDWFAFPEEFAGFLVARMTLNAVLGVLYFVTARRFPIVSQSVLCMATGALLLWVIYGSGAPMGDYYVGLILAMVGLPVLLPLDPTRTAVMWSILVAGFVVSPALADGPDRREDLRDPLPVPRLGRVHRRRELGLPDAFPAQGLREATRDRGRPRRPEGDGPHQVALHGQRPPRAAHPAHPDPGAARGDPLRGVRPGARRAPGLPRDDARELAAPAQADQQPARPGEGRGTAVHVASTAPGSRGARARHRRRSASAGDAQACRADHRLRGGPSRHVSRPGSRREDRGESPRERAEVHRRRRSHRDPPAVPSRGRPAGRLGYRCGRAPRSARAHLRPLRPGGHVQHAEARRHRHRPLAREGAGGPARRKRLGGERGAGTRNPDVRGLSARRGRPGAGRDRSGRHRSHRGRRRLLRRPGRRDRPARRGNSTSTAWSTSRTTWTARPRPARTVFRRRPIAHRRERPRSSWPTTTRTCVACWARCWDATTGCA